MEKIHNIFESFDDYMSGGHGDNTDETLLDQNQLPVGREVEREHSDNPKVANKIAVDHLTAVPDYYTKLIAAGLVDEQEALDLYIKIFGNLPTI